MRAEEQKKSDPWRMDSETWWSFDGPENELSARDDDPYAGRGLLHSNSGVAGSVGQVT